MRPRGAAMRHAPRALRWRLQQSAQHGREGMSVVLGSGEHRYRVVENWAKLPDGWNLTDVAAVGVDSKDRIYVFNRGEHPMVVLNRDGSFIKSWGEGLFRRAHGLHIDSDDNLYCTDDGDHTVRKCTVDGKVLLTIGIPEKPAVFMSNEPFNRCTHTALSPRGDIYVSDGYGNACVHKFTPDGKLIKTWGEPGTDEGQFNLVHNIVTDADDVVHQIELPFVGAWLAPCLDQLSVGCELVHAGIAVAVRHIDIAARRERRVGAAVERLVAHEHGRLLRNADRKQHLAVYRALAHRMVAIVGAIEVVVGIDVQAVRPAEQPLRSEEHTSELQSRLPLVCR